MAAGNFTGDPQAPRSQLSLADTIVIVVYFAVNLAVGIWVRGRRGAWAWALAASPGDRGALGPAPRPGVDLSETATIFLSLFG